MNTEDMIADIGTRKLTDVRQVAPDSTWILSLPWMRGSEDHFPILTVDEINPTQEDIAEASKEMLVVKTFHAHESAVMDHEEDEQIRSRYQFSKYLIDPNRFRFRKVVRINSLVLSVSL